MPETHSDSDRVLCGHVENVLPSVHSVSQTCLLLSGPEGKGLQVGVDRMLTLLCHLEKNVEPCLSLQSTLPFIRHILVLKITPHEAGESRTYDSSSREEQTGSAGLRSRTVWSKYQPLASDSGMPALARDLSLTGLISPLVPNSPWT